MSKVSLNSIIGKNRAFRLVFSDLLQSIQARLWVEDMDGRVLLGERSESPETIEEILVEEERLGLVKGDKSTSLFAALLRQLLEKELEKKKLGSEVLNLYQEINVIFNFSEQLSQTIEPEIIARLALEQALRTIQTDGGIVVLWNHETKELKVPHLEGEDLFDQENFSSNPLFLLELGLSGQSEIVTDLSGLKDKGLVSGEVNSLMYAAMKAKHRIVGAIVLARKNTEAFTAANLKLLITLALQSSSAIESAMLYEKNIREAKRQQDAILAIHEVTKKFVPHEFIKSLGKENLTDVRLGDQAERIVTVLFTDIRDFTTLSEGMSPEENFRFVSSFNERLGPIIRTHNGFINQYLGDSIMAIFPDSSSDALEAAISMQRAIQDMSRERMELSLAPIRAGIGMHTGPLIMGITGDEQRMDAATISDTVNTAARIESLTKQFNSPLLLSQDTLMLLEDREKYNFRNLGEVQLKGKLKALAILECFDGYEKDDRRKRLNTLACFNRAMQEYLEGEYEKAELLFESILLEDPGDMTVRNLFENARRYRKEGSSFESVKTLEKL